MSSTKKNFIFSLGMLIVGTLSFTIYNLGIIEKGMLSSTLSGLGWGLTFTGLIASIIYYITLKNPKKLKESEILENDERNVYIREKSGSKVYSIFIYVECAIVIIAPLLGYEEVAYVLSFLLVAKLLTWAFVATKL